MDRDYTRSDVTRIPFEWIDYFHGASRSLEAKRPLFFALGSRRLGGIQSSIGLVSKEDLETQEFGSSRIPPFSATSRLRTGDYDDYGPA